MLVCSPDALTTRRGFLQSRFGCWGVRDTQRGWVALAEALCCSIGTHLHLHGACLAAKGRVWLASCILPLQQGQSWIGLLLLQFRPKRGALSPCTTVTFVTILSLRTICVGILSGFAGAPCWITLHISRMRAQKVARLHSRSSINIYIHL